MSTNSQPSNENSEQAENQIPDALRSRDQWFCWLMVENQSGGEQKVPFNPATEDRANIKKPDSLLEFDTARTLDNAQAFDTAGLGFGLIDDDSLISVDLFDAAGEDGIKDWAEEAIQKLDSYAEYGPEMENIRVYLNGQLPKGGAWCGDVRFSEMRHEPVTGNRVEASPRSIEQREDALKEVYDNYVPDDYHCEPDTSDVDSDSDSAVAEVRETVTDEFDSQTWDVTEASLSVSASLLIEGLQSCTGLVIVGETGAGKSTVIRFFDDTLDDLVERSDDATPASFVSAEPSKEEEELEKLDLLPRIQHKLMTCKDMSSWFAGDQASIQRWMSVVANVMDGNGYVRDTGSHGQRGYTGDYRFAFLGASTPLPRRAWDVMGHTGNRLVFHEKSKMMDMSQAVSDVFEDDDYGKKVARCQEAVRTLLKGLWSEHGGYGSVEWEGSLSDELQQVFEYLTMLVVHARAPVENGTTKKEGPHRIATTLRDIARGHALLCGRKQVEIADAQVCARIALSTMPKERRPVIRAVLNPANGQSVSTSELTDQTPYTEPTVLKRMKLLETLGIAECQEVDDRGTKVVERREIFEWPELLEFPEF